MSTQDNIGTTTRRDFVQGSLAVAGTMLASSVPGAAATQTEIKRPNLLFIYTEGQRADAQGIAGNPLLKTPNQDRIAREGARFTNSFLYEFPLCSCPRNCSDRPLLKNDWSPHES